MLLHVLKKWAFFQRIIMTAATFAIVAAALPSGTDIGILATFVKELSR